MKKLYCFDFDGTITKEDTMFSFLRFYNPQKYYINFIKYIPLFILLKLGVIEAEQVKMSFISSILKGETKECIDKKSKEFFNKNYPKIIRKKAIDFIEKIDKTQTECYLVTASLDIWAEIFAQELGMKLIATKTKFEKEIYTGKFASKNCNGQEKVNRIQEIIEHQKYDKIIAFGDTSGDKEMLAWADEGYYRFFH